jgi:ADP-heptose:LPS heptosyltransferase
VACNAGGAPIARACAAVNEVILLPSGSIRWWYLLKIASLLQGFDWVIAAKGGFDRRLARLTRLTQAAVRIGFQDRHAKAAAYYTDPVPLPDDYGEHQIDVLLRLLRPLGIEDPPLTLAIEIPSHARYFVERPLTSPQFAPGRQLLVMNISSTARLKFHREDFFQLTARILAETDFRVAFVAAPRDQPTATALADRLSSDRAAAIATPSPMELAALMERATAILTPEGGAAHLAAAVGIPAVILWSEGPFDKWRSRGRNHVFVRPRRGEKSIPVDRVWQELVSLLQSLPETRPA